MTVNTQLEYHERDRLVEKAIAFLRTLNGEMYRGVQKALYVQAADVLTEGDLPVGEFDRIYFGVEFCERRIPSVHQLEKAISICREDGKPLTLVTPIVTDWGLKRLNPLFGRLMEYDEHAEVVVNEYGTLMFLREKFPSFKVVMGRVLIRQKKDPRVPLIHDEKIRGYFSGSVLDSAYFCKFLHGQNTRRVELDNLPHAQPPQADFSVSLYYPFVFITTSRNCVAETCDECARVHYMLYHPTMGDGLIFYGRSQFFVNLNLNWLENSRIDRIVYQFYVPL
ncbi:MAG: hypothetical protein AB1546_12125 [bacterium]